jgi:nicotinamidase-related amidase
MVEGEAPAIACWPSRHPATPLSGGAKLSQQSTMGNLKDRLGAENTVHLCIDMQRLFAPDGPWPTPWLRRVLPVVTALVEYAPQRTIFTRFITPAKADDAPGMWAPYYRKWHSATQTELDPGKLELLPELSAHVPPARVVDKQAYSAFSNPELHPFLRNHRIDTLVLTGSETDVCVLSTALSAVDHGYRVVIVQDGVCSSSDASHDALIELYDRRFDIQIELANSRQVLAAWYPESSAVGLARAPR